MAPVDDISWRVGEAVLADGTRHRCLESAGSVRAALTPRRLVGCFLSRQSDRLNLLATGRRLHCVGAQRNGRAGPTKGREFLRRDNAGTGSQALF